MSKEIVPFGVEFVTDSENRLSLTDLWSKANCPESKRPNDWIARNSEFIDNVIVFLNATKNGIIKTKKGKGGGTFAHKQVALAYAKYLDPKLHIIVNQIFFERIAEEKNPELSFQRGIENYKKQGKDGKWIDQRFKGIVKRNEFTSTLSRHGVNSQQGFKDCTNAIYKPLYGGNTALIRAKKGIDKNANIRDNMDEIELACVSLSEMLATKAITDHGMNGAKECERACLISAKAVAKSVIESRKNNSLFFDKK